MDIQYTLPSARSLDPDRRLCDAYSRGWPRAPESSCSPSPNSSTFILVTFSLPAILAAKKSIKW